MKKKIVYEDVPLGRVTRVSKDFLPKPEDLVFKESNVRVTLNLSNSSVSFFKELGRKNRIPYQKLIRRALDEMTNRAA